MGTKSCFVAYPFQDPFERYCRDLYRAAIGNAGLEAVSARDIFAAGDVVRQIAKAIYESDVVLADLSLPNANVYYEVGLAHAWHKPVVIVTQSASSIPFDLRGGRMHIYDKDDPSWGDSLVTALTRSLIETIADPLVCLPGGFIGLSAAEMGESSDEKGSATDDIWMQQIEERLGQLQRSIEVSTRSVDPSPAVLAKAESARDAVRIYLRQGVPKDEIVAKLVAAGTSKLWAQDAVESVERTMPS